MYRPRDWVEVTLLTERLSMNDRAVEYLENHEHLIDMNHLVVNENAVHIIEKRIQDYDDDYGEINGNKNAMNFLRNNRQYIDYFVICQYEHGIEFVNELLENNELKKLNWPWLSSNPAAMHILNDPKYYEYIHWYSILENQNAAEFIKNNMHMVDDQWDKICAQPHLMDIIKHNMDEIDWMTLSLNYNAIYMLEQNLDKIDIYNLCHNKNGFELLLRLNHVFDNRNHYHENIVFEYFDYCEKNNIQFNLVDQLSRYGYTENHMEFLKHNNNYYYLLMNPNIFEYDYERMRETRQALQWYNDIKK